MLLLETAQPPQGLLHGGPRLPTLGVGHCSLMWTKPGGKEAAESYRGPQGAPKRHRGDGEAHPPQGSHTGRGPSTRMPRTARPPCLCNQENSADPRSILAKDKEQRRVMLLGSRVSAMPAGDANPENNTRQPALPPRAASGPAHGGQPHPSWLASNGQHSDRTLVLTTGSGLRVADTLKSGSCTGVPELNLVQEGFGNLQKYSTRHLACSSKQARGGNDQLCFLSGEAEAQGGVPGSPEGECWVHLQPRSHPPSALGTRTPCLSCFSCL